MTGEPADEKIRFINKVLLRDGWHTARVATFDPFDFPHSNASTFTFTTESNGTISGPIASVLAVQRTAPRIPAARLWCGKCNGGEVPEVSSRRLVSASDGRVAKCPDCHPAVAPALGVQPLEDCLHCHGTGWAGDGLAAAISVCSCLDRTGESGDHPPAALHL